MKLSKLLLQFSGAIQTFSERICKRIYHRFLFVELMYLQVQCLNTRLMYLQGLYNQNIYGIIAFTESRGKYEQFLVKLVHSKLSICMIDSCYKKCIRKRVLIPPTVQMVSGKEENHHVKVGSLERLKQLAFKG